MGSIILSAQHLRKTYGKNEALRDLSLEVVEGEILAIMGASGSGKSTLLHVMAGIELPDQGVVYYNGQEVTHLSDSLRTVLRRTEFGFVFQFSQLVPELTALDNIAVPMLLGGVGRQRAYKEAEYWLDKVELGKYADALPGQLSGGEAQRIAIARALSVHPKILFADEPTGSLDTINSEKVMNLLVSLVHEQGMSVVIVTHETTVAAYADREIMIRDGQRED